MIFNIIGIEESVLLVNYNSQKDIVIPSNCEQLSTTILFF